MKEYRPNRFHQGQAFPASSPLLDLGTAPAGTASGYGWPSEREPKSNLLLEYLRMLARRRKTILLMALSGAVAGLLLNLSVLPLYRAHTSLDIQSLSGDSMDRQAVAPTGDLGSGSTDSYVQTRIKMLQSDTLLDRTIHTLQAQPHPACVERDDLLSRIKAALHLGRSAPIPYSVLLHDAAGRIKVKPLALTSLVEITCDSWNPRFSAQVCNTLADTFRNDGYATRGEEATTTSEWFTHQVADVRAQAEDSERKLEAAAGGNALVLNTNSNSVTEDRLSRMQEELVRAQADRMEKQAALEAITSVPVGSLPSVIDNANFRHYGQQLAELRDQVARIVPPLTEENPKVTHLRSQIAEVEAEMERERATIVSRLKDEYVSARHREELLEVTYHVQEANTSSGLGKTKKVNLLRRQVDSEQQLYQTLLQRAKGAGFASAVPVNTIRVIDEAAPPRLPFSPRISTGVGAGFLIGSLCGVGLAFYKERASGLIRFPGQAPRRLDVEELGVIPRMEPRRRLSDPSLKTLLRRRDEGSPVPSSPPMALSGSVEEIEALRIWTDRFSVAAEAYRNTTFSILRAGRMFGLAKMYVVSSPNAGDGKTTVVSNLGVALSQARRRVVIVDGDLRKPGLHKSLGMPNTVGLRDVLRGDINPVTGSLDAFCHETSIANLFIVTSGSGEEEVTNLLHSSRAGDLLRRLSEEFDLVLIDTPPMLHVADTRIFADHTDGVILVFRARVTNIEQARAAHEILVHDQVRILGTILNDFDPDREGMGGYYKSYYRYKDAVRAEFEGRAKIMTKDCMADPCSLNHPDSTNRTLL